MTQPTQPARYEYVAIGLVAGSMLMHEILLTRICALRLHFHFAYLVISNCLLAMGAGGSVLALYQTDWRRDPRLWLRRFTLAYLATLVVTFFVLSHWPMPRELNVSQLSHVLSLFAFNLVGATPFFFGGIVVGILLTFRTEHVNRLYAVDLVGAGIGCLACPLLLRLVGAGGVFVCVVLLALCACVALYGDAIGNAQRYALGLVVVGALVLLPRFDALFPIPSKGELLADVVPGLPPGKITRSWTSNSRVDVEIAPKGLDAFIFMSGATPSPIRPPKEWAHISQDASAGTAIINYSDEPQGLELLKGSMYSSAYRLTTKPRVLVIGLGGANDVWAAKAHGATSVRAIELNPPVVDTHRSLLRKYSRVLVEDPSVEFVIGEGRSELMRDSRRYDVVQMSGIDTWTALASGAYVLAENYLYTREAIAAMYRRLEPGGIIQIARFAASMEALRLFSNISAALRDFGVDTIEHSVMALATPDKMMAVLLKNGSFSQADQESTREFADANGIRLVYLPIRPVNTVVDRFVRDPNKEEMIERFAQNIEPTNDDKPYFFNFTKWQRPIESIRHIDDIPAVSQGNPFFILTHLALSVVLGVALILWPLSRSAGSPRRGVGAYLIYFSALGMGFILIEIAIMQKLTLFLGQPMYSLTVTLFSLLVFTGLGSLLVVKRIENTSRALWLLLLGILGYILLFNGFATSMFQSLIGASLPVRVSTAIAILAPLGILLGVPFALGLRLAGQRDPWLAPWAWGINGCSSVIGSILSVVLSMNFGFTSVLWIAAVIYALGFIALQTALKPQ